MAENKTNPISAAAKIAQSNKETKEALAQAAADTGASGVTESGAGEAQDSGIQVGATVGGSMMKGGDRPAGAPSVAKAPGYYSRHAGKVRVGSKVYQWPMEAPLMPQEGEDELRAILDSMVERNLATYVGDPKDDE